MLQTKSPRLTLLALLLLVLVALTCLALGRWQLERAEQRRATALTITLGRQATPLSLNEVTHARLQELKAWTPASAQGQWRGDLSLLIDNRNLDGRPGLWLATPLVMPDTRAILVLRGWFERPLADKVSPVVLTPGGPQRLEGELAEHVPRLFELSGSGGAQILQFAHGAVTVRDGTDSVDTAKLARVQNVTIADLVKQTGLNLLPVVLLQTNSANDGLIRRWPEPSIDADKNNGYALQWFGFALIALIAFVVVGWRAMRRPQPR